jgi:hypothetical protein
VYRRLFIHDCSLFVLTSGLFARASFYSTPEQVAKREELEAQLKALKLADEEAAFQARRDQVAAEKARKAATGEQPNVPGISKRTSKDP